MLILAGKPIVLYTLSCAILLSSLWALHWVLNLSYDSLCVCDDCDCVLHCLHIWFALLGVCIGFTLPSRWFYYGFFSLYFLDLGVWIHIRWFSLEFRFLWLLIWAGSNTLGEWVQIVSEFDWEIPWFLGFMPVSVSWTAFFLMISLVPLASLSNQTLKLDSALWITIFHFGKIFFFFVQCDRNTLIFFSICDLFLLLLACPAPSLLLGWPVASIRDYIYLMVMDCFLLFFFFVNFRRMPLLKKKSHKLLEPPNGLEPREAVYQVRLTKEIFRDYQYPFFYSFFGFMNLEKKRLLFFSNLCFY